MIYWLDVSLEHSKTRGQACKEQFFPGTGTVMVNALALTSWQYSLDKIKTHKLVVKNYSQRTLEQKNCNKLHLHIMVQTCTCKV